jgi:hypothetical protein
MALYIFLTLQESTAMTCNFGIIAYDPCRGADLVPRLPRLGEDVPAVDL